MGMWDKHNWDNVKLQEEVFITVSWAHSTSYQYYIGKVVSITKTRFTVSFNGKEKVFTKDRGGEYPRKTGYGGASYYVEPMTPEKLELMELSTLVTKGRNLMYDIATKLSAASTREAAFNKDIAPTDMREMIAFLQKVKTALPDKTKG